MAKIRTKDRVRIRELIAAGWTNAEIRKELDGVATLIDIRRQREGMVHKQNVRHRLLILKGRSDKQIAKQLGIDESEVAKERHALDRQKIFRTTELISVTQAAYVLGLTTRRVRFICEEGRLGRRVGSKGFVITRQELIAFGERTRSSGVAGQRAKQEECKQGQ